MSEQNYLRADSLVRKIADDPVGDTVRFAMLNAYKKGDAAEARRLTDMMMARPHATMFSAIDLSVMDPHAARELAKGIQSKRKPGRGRETGAVVLGILELERGRPNAAFAQVDSTGPMRTEVKAMLALLPLVQLPREQLQALYDEVQRSDSVAVTGSEDPRAQIQPHARLYYMGMLSCRLGRTAEALQLADRIDALPIPPYWKPAMNALATNVRAQADIANGNAKAALARIESIQTDVPFDLLFTAGSRLPELFWHAELLYLTGRNDEALEWFENIDDFVGYEVPVYSYALLRRAELLERKGQTREAMALYSQVLRNWSEAEPAFQPYVTQARSSLARLQRKVG